MKYILFALLACAGSLAHIANAASVNDYSILIPLPAPEDFGQLLAPHAESASGPLIPTEIFNRLPPLVVESDNKATYQNTLRVVALRLDPCFVEGPPINVCRRQIRMVWQPVLKIPTGVTTRDAAVHTFYEFKDDATWNQLLEAWQSLRSGERTDPLQIHPVMKAQTLKGPFWQQLRATLLKFTGPANLVRVTVMNVFGNERIWEFSGFDIVDGKITSTPIARINSPSQIVGINIDLKTEFVGAVRPQPEEDEDFFELIRSSAALKKSVTESEMKDIISTAFAYANPKLHNTATLDCASCHLAESTRRWGQQTFPDWQWTNDFSTRYANPWFRADATLAPFKANQLRAFGYFLKEPVITERVVNETLEVVNAFTQAPASRTTYLKSQNSFRK